VTAKAHADAIKALIGTSVRLFEGNRPEDSPLPAAVLFVDTGTGERTTLTHRSDRRNVAFQITSVGLDPEGVRSVAERVRTAVLDRRPVVPGRTTWMVIHDDSTLMRLDRDVTPHVFFLVDLYSFSSVPAPAPIP
jgi:hypothetical protein